MAVAGTAAPQVPQGAPTPSPTPTPTPTPTPFCTVDTWSATTTTGAPSTRGEHTAIWTGSVMIIWGGIVSPGPVFTNTGGKYDPGTDSWTATSTTNAPSARRAHTAVWIGTEMIVWGGTGLTVTGGRYNPSTDTWTATTTVSAPEARTEHTAVWTGSEMIVWGGRVENGSLINTGARYNPTTNTWRPTSTINAPANRGSHTAVWTGREMIIWGGTASGGARYNPATDTWTPVSTTNAPPDRSGHSAVWTGTEMIVWGGNGNLDTGGRYNPAADTWTPTSVTNAPLGRGSHSAVWTGLEMIIWGGVNTTASCELQDGWRYNPSLDSWTATTTVNAPHGRVIQTEVWTGRQMIVWGGSQGDVGCPDFEPSLPNYLRTGGRYCVNSGPVPGPATHFEVVAPPEVVMFNGFHFTVRALDQFNNTATGYTGTVHFTTTSPQAFLPPDGTLTTGFRDFSADLQSEGIQTITATDTVNSNITGTSNDILVHSDIPPPPPTPTPTPTPGSPTPTPSPSATPTATEAFPPFAEIGVTNTDSPDPVQVGQNLTYTITVTNNSSSFEYPLPTVTMTDHLPGSVTFVSVTPTQGSCTGTTTVTCNFGILPRSQSATVTLVVTPTAAGPLSNTASASSSYSFDPNPANNSATASTTVVSQPTPTPTSTPTPTPTKALNLATRLRVQSGDNVGIGGFIISGGSDKTVAIRAIGPSLAGFGISDFLADPTLELRNSSGLLLISNDNWQDTPTDQGAQLIAHGLAPQDPKESGFVATLPSGASYTAILAGKNQGSGVGLVEIYDVDQTAGAELANISTRGFVMTGNNVMIGGFILGGDGNTRIVVRGIGPSLAQFGLNPVLADPTLELHDSNGATLVSNNDWQDDPASAAQLTAFGLAPQSVKEAAIATSMPPGAFTGILAGANGGTGIGLIEIYNVH